MTKMKKNLKEKRWNYCRIWNGGRNKTAVRDWAHLLMSWKINLLFGEGTVLTMTAIWVTQTNKNRIWDLYAVINTNKVKRTIQRVFAMISLSYHNQRLAEVLNRGLFALLGHKILPNKFTRDRRATCVFSCCPCPQILTGTKYIYCKVARQYLRCR